MNNGSLSQKNPLRHRDEEGFRVVTLTDQFKIGQNSKAKLLCEKGKRIGTSYIPKLVSFFASS
jgi:hypothetical protein